MYLYVAIAFMLAAMYNVITYVPLLSSSSSSTMERKLTYYTTLIYQAAGVPPLRLTVDCSDERIQSFSSPFKLSNYNRKFGSDLNVNSFCNLIHNVIPDAVEDGKFIIIKPHTDQEGFSDTHMPIAIAPPKGFIPTLGSTKWKVPQLKVPKLYVPKLEARESNHRKTPNLGVPMPFISSMLPKEDSSAERMGKIQKGIQQMLRFVKVLGQIDQYLSERIRIIIDKMSKTFAE